jgi:threonine dehydratase
VHAFDQDETMLGQGTLGMELDEQAPNIDTVLVSVGGGGLIAGVAGWYAGRVRVIGVEPFASPTLTKALEAEHPIDVEAGGVAADSLAPRRGGDRVFPIAEKYVHSTVLVAEDAILNAQKVLWEVLRVVAEPGGVAAFSAILSGAYKPMTGERVAVIISGGNTTAVKFEH